MFQDNSNIFLINPGHEFHAKLSIVSATYDTRTHKILSATVFVPSKTLRETRVFPRAYDPSTHTFPLLEIEPTRDRFRKSNLPAIEEAKLAVHLSSSFAIFLRLGAGVSPESKFPSLRQLSVLYPGVDLRYQMYKAVPLPPAIVLRGGRGGRGKTAVESEAATTALDKVEQSRVIVRNLWEKVG